MKALEVTGLCKQYENFALDNVTFSLEQGTITGLVGRNGAGKTTILRSILGAAHIDAGTISFLGKPIDAQTKQEIGVVYDTCCFSEMLKIGQLDRVLGDIYHNWSRDVFFGMCEHYELPENKTIKTFSRGMKQKLSIAAALAHSPRLLLLDEPTGGLDPVAREQILNDLQTFIEDGEHTVLLSTHITSDLDRVADNILIVSHGRIQIDTDKDTLLDEYVILKGSPEQLEQMEKTDILGIKKHAYSFEALCRGRERMREKYPQFVCDSTDIEQILVLLEGGADV